MIYDLSVEISFTVRKRIVRIILELLCQKGPFRERNGVVIFSVKTTNDKATDQSSVFREPQEKY